MYSYLPLFICTHVDLYVFLQHYPPIIDKSLWLLHLLASCECMSVSTTTPPFPLPSPPHTMYYHTGYTLVHRTEYYIIWCMLYIPYVYQLCVDMNKVAVTLSLHLHCNQRTRFLKIHPKNGCNVVLNDKWETCIYHRFSNYLNNQWYPFVGMCPVLELIQCYEWCWCRYVGYWVMLNQWYCI